MNILICFFFASFLIACPLLSFAALFDIKDESQMKAALNMEISVANQSPGFFHRPHLPF
jgi:hypothetical protein